MSMHTDSGQVVNGSAQPRAPGMGRFAARAGIALATLASVTGCTSQQTTGESAAYLQIDALSGRQAPSPSKFGGCAGVRRP